MSNGKKKPKIKAIPQAGRTTTEPGLTPLADTAKKSKSKKSILITPVVGTITPVIGATLAKTNQLGNAIKAHWDKWDAEIESAGTRAKEIREEMGSMSVRTFWEQRFQPVAIDWITLLAIIRRVTDEEQNDAEKKIQAVSDYSRKQFSSSGGKARHGNDEYLQEAKKIVRDLHSRNRHTYKSRDGFVFDVMKKIDDELPDYVDKNNNPRTASYSTITGWTKKLEKKEEI